MASERKGGREAQLSDKELHHAPLELHYASLRRLPVPSTEEPDLGDGEGEGQKEDPGANYACIAKNKPT
ncbi:PREDICTED: leukocyte-specific transcript 1 protein [Galeopterus variegatus]|uniref:Leukocyte-specific transcript 1 protein n=1 Tax=Galeopterus variegatus TaxID=482537 RepID=A0ABM0Q6B7_GALVR|nr:PREDICTED: leukocyte-specific transcript 1 protein [Galeopterus variegatus]